MIVGSTKIDLNVPKSAAIVSLLSLLNLRKEEDEAGIEPATSRVFAPKTCAVLQPMPN